MERGKMNREAERRYKITKTRRKKRKNEQTRKYSEVDKSQSILLGYNHPPLKSSLNLVVTTRL